MLHILGAFLGSFLVLIFSGIPIAIVASLVGMSLLYAKGGWENMILAVNWVLWGSAENFTLISLPMFILMGYLLTESRIGEKVYTAMAPLLNHFPGGLLHSNIVAGALFAACSGSSIASAATIGSIAFPEMEKRRYPFSLAAGSVGAGSILAPLIPPSLHMIFYASITDVSIGRLFMGGMIPGIILTVMFLVYIGIRLRFHKGWNEMRGEVFPWEESLRKSKDLWPVLTLIVLVLGSIFIGIATPTEAAAVGAFGAIILALIHRTFSWQMLKKSTISTVRVTSQLMFIYVACKVMSAALARGGLISNVTEYFLGLPVPPIAILLMVYMLFLIMGTLMESIPLMLIIVPVIFPTLVALGYDPLWFGIAVVLLNVTGNFTPPVGVTLFVLQSLQPGKPITEIYKGLAPFCLCLLLMLAILTLFPELATFLPDYLLGK
jgi:C4-dicarboxylate transporter DctM subunit